MSHKTSPRHADSSVLEMDGATLAVVRLDIVDVCPKEIYN